MIRRMGHCILPLLRSLDILACTIWLCCLYPFGLASRPSGREMISSYVGEAQFNGHRWAMRAAAVIDWCACRLGDRPDHCLRAFCHYQFLDD